MKADVILKKKEDAVSPVIGVMLMLVVTIVIAAVVAAFAGGLGSDVERAPTAALDLDVYSDGKVRVSSLSGETLVTKDITIKVTDADGSPLGNGNLDGNYKELSFSPGTTTVVTLSDEKLETGDYVTVTVLANGKYVIAKKEVMVGA